MKIRLNFDIPVDPALGMSKDRILDVIEEDGIVQYMPGRRKGYAWVKGDGGKVVKLHPHEFEIVEP